MDWKPILMTEEESKRCAYCVVRQTVSKHGIVNFEPTCALFPYCGTAPDRRGTYLSCKDIQLTRSCRFKLREITRYKLKHR